MNKGNLKIWFLNKIYRNGKDGLIYRNILNEAKKIKKSREEKKIITTGSNKKINLIKEYK